MKLQKQNVIYRTDKPEEIEALKARGFKEVKEKAKAELNPKPKAGTDKPEDNKESK